MSEKDFDKGYKSGFKFGKEVMLDKVKQAREDIDAQCGKRGLDDYDYCSGLIFARNILDKLIAESEGLINDKSIL